MIDCRMLCFCVNLNFIDILSDLILFKTVYKVHQKKTLASNNEGRNVIAQNLHNFQFAQNVKVLFNIEDLLRILFCVI